MAAKNVMQMMDLGGKVALVTGGSRGLGLQMAEVLGELGAKVAITARKQRELDEAIAHLERRGVSARAWAADLSRREEIEPLTAKVLGHYGKVDILVNNAGAGWGAPLETHPLHAWDKVVHLNLTVPFVLSQLIGVRSMIPAKWGRIINNASVAGLFAPDPRVIRTAAYNASKSGLIGLTRTFAAEWGPHGITANALCPGFFPSKLTGDVLDEAVTRLVLEHTPSRRLGNEEDLKGVIALLATEAGRHINGQAIAVDGGSVAMR